MKEKILKN